VVMSDRSPTVTHSRPRSPTVILSHTDAHCDPLSMSPTDTTSTAATHCHTLSIVTHCPAAHCTQLCITRCPKPVNCTAQLPVSCLVGEILHNCWASRHAVESYTRPDAIRHALINNMLTFGHTTRRSKQLKSKLQVGEGSEGGGGVEN
jgi:hypothetical protein